MIMLSDEQKSTIIAILFCLFMVITPAVNTSIIAIVAIIYFTWDLRSSMQYMYIIHHVLSIIGFVWVLFTEPVLQQLFITSSKSMENSNVTLYINYFIVVSGLKNWNNKYYKIFFILHVINYIYWRLINVGLIIISNYDLIIQSPVLLLSLIIYIGSCYWSILLIHKCHKYKVFQWNTNIINKSNLKKRS
jgi:hypothetical protein